jgi:hypothetical protein
MCMDLPSPVSYYIFPNLPQHRSATCYIHLFALIFLHIVSIRFNMSFYAGSSHPRLSASNLSTHRKDTSLDRAVIPYTYSSKSHSSRTRVSDRPSELTVRPTRPSSKLSSSSNGRSSQRSHRPPSSAGGAKGTQLPSVHSMTVTDTVTTDQFEHGVIVSSTSESRSHKITREDRMPVILEDLPQITYPTRPARSYTASRACPDCVPDSGEVRPDESASNVSRHSGSRVPTNVSRRSGETAGSRPPSSNPRYSTYSGR